MNEYWVKGGIKEVGKYINSINNCMIVHNELDKELEDYHK